MMREEWIGKNQMSLSHSCVASVNVALSPNICKSLMSGFYLQHLSAALRQHNTNRASFEEQQQVHLSAS